MASIVEVIQHYQRSIDSSQDNEARLLHCINKLYKLPIKVEHLQETGVGKTVNSLRKFNGEIGVAAKTLVTKWKAMVAAEEEPMETIAQTTDTELQNDTNGGDGGPTAHNNEDDEHNAHNSTEQKREHRKRINDDNNDKHKDHSKNSSSGNTNSDRDISKHSTSKQSDKQNVEKSSKNSHDKHKSSSKYSKDGHSSSSKSNPKDKEREKEKSDYKTSRDKHKNRDHDKDKERSEKHRHENSKSSRDHKTDSPNSSHSSQLNSNCHTSSSKSKHEEKPSRSSSSKDKERSNKHKSSSKDKKRIKDEKQPSDSTLAKEKPEHKSISTSSTSTSPDKDPNRVDLKRSHNSDNDSIDFKSPPPKMVKLHKTTSSTTASRGESSPPLVPDVEELADDCFDSSMGANFDDVLGMLNIPTKNSKKSVKTPSTPSNSSNSTSKKDTLGHRQLTTNNTSTMSHKVSDTKLSFTSNTSNSYSTPSSSKASTMKPDLLAPTAKLEPLDPSIALELPIISTNYKPMPLNQTVMDCVFNNAFSSSKPVRTLTDAEAITHGISSKTMRTKIYSGVRPGQTFQVPSLFDMCIRLLQKNIDALEYTGGVPFEVLKPVLERATPQQLYVFEEYNPYLMEDSDVLWQQHVSRNYRTKKRIENESWREMFIRCQEEEERRLSVLKDSIKASQKIAAAPVRKTQLAFVDSMVKPPRNVLKKQEQFGTKAKLVATPAARVASLSSVTPNAAKTGDQRLKVIAAVRDHAQVSSSSIRPKKAPLMQKTLQFIRGRHKR